MASSFSLHLLTKFFQKISGTVPWDFVIHEIQETKNYRSLVAEKL